MLVMATSSDSRWSRGGTRTRGRTRARIASTDGRVLGNHPSEMRGRDRTRLEQGQG